MQRYFFHIHIEDGASEVDDIGADFASEADAVHEARSLAEALMAESVKVGNRLKQLVEVTDESGRSIVRLDGQVEIAESRSQSR